MEIVFTTKQIKEVFGLSPKTAMVDTAAYGQVQKIGRNSWVIKKKENISVNAEGKQAMEEAYLLLNESLKRENERLIKTLEYYATADMRDITLLDGGRRAKEVLEQ